MRGTSLLSAMLQCAVSILPWRIRRAVLQGVLKFDIHADARIGFSIVMADKLVLGEFSRIKHLTIIKGMAEILVEPYGRIGNLNWITGMPRSNKTFFLNELDRLSSLEIGAHASLTNRHLLDCTNRIKIGKFATVGGFRSQILTHSIDLKTCRQSSAPIEIGAYCFLGTHVTLLKGSRLPAYSVLGAGSVLRSKFEDEYSLYSGVPATKVQAIDPSYGYFNREVGAVY